MALLDEMRELRKGGVIHQQPPPRLDDGRQAFFVFVAGEEFFEAFQCFWKIADIEHDVALWGEILIEIRAAEVDGQGVA